MTTVSDPTGTPSPVYNRSGVAILPRVTSGNPTVIPNVVCERTVVVVDLGMNNQVELPGNCEIGDAVEVYYSEPSGEGNALVILPPDGDDFVNGVAGVSLNRASGGAFFRKFDASTWVYIQSNLNG